MKDKKLTTALEKAQEKSTKKPRKLLYVKLEGPDYEEDNHFNDEKSLNDYLSKHPEVKLISKKEVTCSSPSASDSGGMVRMSKYKDKKRTNALEKAQEKSKQRTAPEAQADSGQEKDMQPEAKFLNLLKNEPGLAARLIEAIETGRWLVTVHFQKKYSPEDKHDLHQFYCIRGYPKNDVPVSLKNTAADFIAKEIPNADLPEDSRWH
jgi:hypothetical protein